MMPYVLLVVAGAVVLALVLMVTGHRPKSDATLLASPRKARIPAELKAQLASIEPSTDRTLLLQPCSYYPCKVRLKNGHAVDKVILSREFPWIKLWGVYPE